ncbi:alcohol dehydrogenase catalytic domain-containing protein [Kineococcus sp. NBC_00420]|uniref:zinc-dependent alcohol dehydrogenase n=1 Tax=Kineococcus sp. NBC_00420 TaxID=2903564 RepID=UPI002E1C1DF3
MTSAVTAPQTTGTVRQVVVNSLDDIQVEHHARPIPGPGEVLLEPTLVGICGSDLHAARGVHPFITLPYRPGHEVVGRVAATGEGVDAQFAPGTRVVLEPNLACGKCPPCQEGRYNICDVLDVIGCQTPGGMTDAFTVAADRLHVLPDDLDDTAAVLVEPLSTPLRAVRRAGALKDKRVVVLGAGPIGLFILLGAVRAGASAVVSADLVGSKRNRAVSFGAAGAVDAAAEDAVEQARMLLGGAADVVFDCVSRDSSVRQGVDLLRKGGKLMTVGVAAGATSIPLDLVQDRELDILGCLMFVREDVQEAIAMLREGVVPVADIITGTFDVEDVAAAYAASADPEQVKIVVRVGAGQPS